MPTFTRHGPHGTDRVGFEASVLIMAGWTGRERAAVDHHIAELAALGVAGPNRIPTYYQMDPALLAGPVDQITVLGDETSGEVEVVLLAFADGLWVGVGSDHTDRATEVHGLAISKQLCRKPMAADLWRHQDVIDHWDRLILRAHIQEDGERKLFMEAPLAEVRRPEDLIAGYLDGLDQPPNTPLPAGTVIFCGAIGAIGGIRPASRFEMELEDPVRGHILRHAYDVVTLPVIT